jgi:AcrR family transcriptional regulator
MPAGSPVVARPPGRPRSAQVHQAILDAAVALFIRDGFEGMSVEAVAARAGVGKAAIYRRWPAKEALVIDAVAQLIAEAPSPDSGSVHDDLVELARELHGLLSSSLTGGLFPRMAAAVERLAGDRVRFADGTEEPFDRIVYATGYRISLPFLAPSLVAPAGRELPLYRRIVAPGLGGLLFAGLVDAPGGLLPVVETQAEWIAALLGGRLRLPAPERMWRAIDRGERRSRERFPREGPHSVRCDPHAYRRLLRADLRRARRRPRPPAAHGRRHAEELASGRR